ncbi:MAG: O-antigen ligase family protein [Sphingomonas sp.]
MQRRDWIQHRWVLALAGAAIALPLLQLVPLPPELWHRLPGRDILVRIDDAARLSDVWRPLTMSPSGTRNALLSLFLPLAAALWLAQLDTAGRERLLFVGILLILASALVGLIQATGAPLNLYARSSSNAGLFANRNHQAVLLACGIVLLGAFAFQWRRPAAEVRMRLIFAGCAAALLIALLLITGSRAGLAAMILAILALPLLYWASLGYRLRSRDRRILYWAIPAALLFLLLVIGCMALLSRDGSITRAAASNMSEELRFPIWHTVLSLVRTYMPLGTGMGSYVEVYQIWEPTEQLRTTYSNHAHNDWLELALTGGIPALALAVLALVLIGSAALKLGRGTEPQRALLGWSGLLVLTIIALASTVDYPLRVPSMQCFAAVALFWILPSGRDARKDARKVVTIPSPKSTGGETAEKQDLYV